MQNWDNLYMLTGTSAGTLIGLIFVVVSLGSSRPKKGDEERTRIFVTPALIEFTSILLVSLATLAPVSNMAQGVVIGAIGTIGVAYSSNLTLLALKHIGPIEPEPWWISIVRIASYACLLVSGVAFLWNAGFADEASAVATVILLLLALRKSWIITIAIVKRDADVE
jgi:hypothetical protein